MNQYPLTPTSICTRHDLHEGYRRETEREIFERIATTMREEQAP